MRVKISKMLVRRETNVQDDEGNKLHQLSRWKNVIERISWGAMLYSDDHYY